MPGIKHQCHAARRELRAELAQGAAYLFDSQIAALNDREAHAFELGGHVFGVIGGVPQGG